MAHSYKFAIIRLSPSDARDERLNIGVAVFSDDNVDVRSARRMDKVRAISGAVESENLSQILSNIRVIDSDFRAGRGEDVASRHARLSRLGPITLSSLGSFIAETSSDYEDRISSILRSMVDAEPAGRVHREKRSKLLTQVKRQFKLERVMALRDEDISSHRIIPSFEVADGLVADLVLRNGAMHVVETVDASGSEDSARKTIGEVGIAALVLERARMKFGEDGTRGRIVYSASPALEKLARASLEAAEHQGAQLINWDSADDRTKFIHSLAMLAIPVPTKRRPKIAFATDPFF